MITLLQKVAEHLSGKRVAVVLRGGLVPQGVNGLCSRKGKVAVIELQADATDDQFLQTFLHEVAHARLHADDLPERKSDLAAHRRRLADLRKAYGDEVVNSIIREREDQANDLAAHWLQMAEKYQTTGGSWLESRLTGLLTSYTVN